MAVALFATSKTILSNLLGASRLLYDVGRDTGTQWLERVTRIDARTKTPVIAISGVTVAALLFGLIGDLRVVAAIGNVLIMIVFLLVNAALIRVRSVSDEESEFRIGWSIGTAPVTAVLAMIGIAALLALNVAALSGAG